MQQNNDSIFSNSGLLQTQLSTYSSKLQSLLTQIQIQNRYSTRVSVRNAQNQIKLETIKKELDVYKSNKKMEQVADMQSSDAGGEMGRQVGQLKGQVEVTAVALLEAKREIKTLKERVKKLEAENVRLCGQTFSKKREDLESMVNFKMEITNRLLENEIKNFLVQVNWRESVLIDHCRECVTNDNYSDFFIKLQEKLHKQLHDKQKRYSVKQKSTSMSRNNMPFQLTKPIRCSGKLITCLPSNDSIQQNLKVHKRLKTLCPVRLHNNL